MKRVRFRVGTDSPVGRHPASEFREVLRLEADKAIVNVCNDLSGGGFIHLSGVERDDVADILGDDESVAGYRRAGGGKPSKRGGGRAGEEVAASEGVGAIMFEPRGGFGPSAGSSSKFQAIARSLDQCIQSPLESPATRPESADIDGADERSTICAKCCLHGNQGPHPVWAIARRGAPRRRGTGGGTVGEPDACARGDQGSWIPRGW